MTESKEKERAIAVTSGYVLGLVLQGALSVYFAGSSFKHALLADWGHATVDALFLAITLYYSFRLAKRIAEKLEK